MGQRDATMWVYGVVPAGARLEELEHRRERLPADVRVVEMGDLGMIVGEAPDDDPRATRDRALAHARVLEAAVLDAPVVPFRFGMAVAGDSVSELLGARHDELAQLLESVRHSVQFTLKADYHQDVVLREIIESQPEVAQLREQTRGCEEITAYADRVRLGELVSVALERIRRCDADAIAARLSRCSVEFTFEPLEREFMALNAPFLVERRRMRVFEGVAGAIATEQAERMHLTLLGPMPAYNFVGAG
jgi:Gas vesicle synthesis protein GvpL/GvpF